MNNKVLVNSLQVDKSLLDLINDEIIPLTTLDKEKFWKSFEDIIKEFTPKNEELLDVRDELQSKIDLWHESNEFNESTFNEYKDYLKQIGYLCDEVEDFKVETKNVDEEIALQAGPQLVVPVKNARFALNAANARWGSLYDALYGTDIISKEGKLTPTKEYNKTRGEAVVTYAKEHLDLVAPLSVGSHKDAVEYKIVNNKLQVKLNDGQIVTLEDNFKLIAYDGLKDAPTSIVFKNNNLHVIVEFDKNSFIGSLDMAGVKDIVVEAAVTTIMD